MNKVQLPKLIKWVLSGACHPIALFNRGQVVSSKREFYKSDVWSFYGEFRHLYKTQAHFNRHVDKIKDLVTPDPKGSHPLTEQYSALIESLKGGPHPLPGHSVSNTIKTLTEFRKNDPQIPSNLFIITDGEEPTTSFAEIGQRFLDDHGLKVEPCPIFNKIMADVPVDPSETNTD